MSTNSMSGNEVTELSAELFRAPNGRPSALPGGEMPDTGTAHRQGEKQRRGKGPAARSRGSTRACSGSAGCLEYGSALGSSPSSEAKDGTRRSDFVLCGSWEFTRGGLSE